MQTTHQIGDMNVDVQSHESKEDHNLYNSANFKYIYEIAEGNLHHKKLKVTQQ